MLRKDKTNFLKLFKTKEEKVAIKIASYFSRKYRADYNFVDHENNKYLYINNNKFDLLLTVCDTNTKRCIKIEEIHVNEKFRNKGVCTNILSTLKYIAEVERITLGLWCELDNKKLFNFYSRLGFKYIETLKDDWLEYN